MFITSAIYFKLHTGYVIINPRMSLENNLDYLTNRDFDKIVPKMQEKTLYQYATLAL